MLHETGDMFVRTFVQALEVGLTPEVGGSSIGGGAVMGSGGKAGWAFLLESEW